MNLNGIVVNPLSKTPTPDIGDCSKTGKWSNNNQIKECESCLEKSTKDYPYFYCDGLCTSEYELGGGQCALNSLVAKTKSQCQNPCQQQGSPRVSGGCQDNYDCPKNQECVSKNVVGPDGMRHVNRGVCQDRKIEHFSILNNCCNSTHKTIIIVLSVLIILILFLLISKII